MARTRRTATAASQSVDRSIDACLAGWPIRRPPEIVRNNDAISRAAPKMRQQYLHTVSPLLVGLVIVYDRTDIDLVANILRTRRDCKTLLLNLNCKRIRIFTSEYVLVLNLRRYRVFALSKLSSIYLPSSNLRISPTVLPDARR